MICCYFVIIHPLLNDLLLFEYISPLLNDLLLFCYKFSLNDLLFCYNSSFIE